MAARFGPPALPTLTVAPVPGRFGQGFPGLIYLSTMSYLAPQNKAIRSLDAHGRLFFSDILQAHETAHQWWGNVVTSAGYHDEWLMEALADYSALLYLENKNGSQPVALALDSYKTNLLQTVNGQDRGIDRSDRAGRAAGEFADAHRLLQHHLRARDRGSCTCCGGAWATSAFWRCWRICARSTSASRFRRRISGCWRRVFCRRNRAGPALENFFDQWVYGTGIPSLKLNYTVKGKGGALRLNGTVTQSDVDRDFSVLAPVEIQLGHGKTLTHWVRTADGPVTFSVALPQAPVKVQLDPNFSLLRR